jgi:hypothetical protein
MPLIRVPACGTTDAGGLGKKVACERRRKLVGAQCGEYGVTGCGTKNDGEEADLVLDIVSDEDARAVLRAVVLRLHPWATRIRIS